MEERIYNMNHYENVRIEDFEYGTTQGITIKVGRKTYKMDIDKNALNARISVYHGKGSKYDGDADLHMASVKNDAIITREVIEHMAEIEKAQDILNAFRGVLDRR